MVRKEVRDVKKIKKVVLFCGKDGCCPTVTLLKDGVLIEDDFGGKVKLTSRQFEILKEKVLQKEL